MASIGDASKVAEGVYSVKWRGREKEIKRGRMERRQVGKVEEMRWCVSRCRPECTVFYLSERESECECGNPRFNLGRWPLLSALWLASPSPPSHFHQCENL